VAGSVGVCSAPGKLGAHARGNGVADSKHESVWSRNAKERVKRLGRSQDRPHTAAQTDVALPSGSLERAQPLDADRTTVRRGERRRGSNHGSCPRVRVQVADLGIEHLRLSRAQAKRKASKGWTTRPASKDPSGELSRAKAGVVPREGVFGRGKPHLSRGAGEAVSILRVPRKPTWEGGSVSRGVTRRQRRSREWSETA